jgi:hypothetical protein
MKEGAGMINEMRRDFSPDNIRELLELLRGEVVTLILESGEKERCVRIEAVIGDLLLVKIRIGDCPRFKFVDIHCICAVIVECEEIIDNLIHRC